MPAGPCHFCGEPNAPFQFRPPGPVSQLPERHRGKYIRACKAEGCRGQAQARIAALTALPVAQPKPSHLAAQASLI